MIIYVKAERLQLDRDTLRYATPQVPACKGRKGQDGEEEVAAAKTAGEPRFPLVSTCFLALNASQGLPVVIHSAHVAWEEVKQATRRPEAGILSSMSKPERDDHTPLVPSPESQYFMISRRCARVPGCCRSPREDSFTDFLSKRLFNGRAA